MEVVLSLQRLAACNSLSQMQQQTLSEKKRFQDCGLHLQKRNVSSQNDLLTDPIALRIMIKYLPSLTACKRPVVSKGDGNCLYSSISLSLFSTDAYSSELRLRAAIEILSNQYWYDKTCDNCAPILKNTLMFVDSYEEYCKNVVILGSYSDFVSCLALSAVLDLPINLHMPPVDVQDDFLFRLFTVCLVGRGVTIDTAEREKDTVHIMWSTLQKQSLTSQEQVHFNHFVPLVDKKKVTLKTNDVSKHKISSTCNLSSILSDSCVSNDSMCSLLTRITKPPNPLHASSPQKFHEEKKGSENVSDTSDTTMASIECSATMSQNHLSGNKNKVQNETYTIDLEEQSFANDTKCEKTTTLPCEGAYQQLRHGFLKIEEVYNALLKVTEQEILKEIPNGYKSNVVFIIDNSSNLNNRACGKKGVYHDDCGAWKSKSSCKTAIFWHQDKNFTCVTYQKEQYWVGKHANRFKLLNPQPNDKDIIIMCRYYSRHNAVPEFCRRISWVIKAPPCILKKNAAIVEYLGDLPKKRPLHGNTKSSLGIPYIRTPQEVMVKAKTAILTQKPNEAYKNIVAENDGDPRNSKVLENAKYAASQQQRKKMQGNIYNANIADHIQSILHMQQTGDYIQSVTFTKHGPPVIILYLNTQLTHLLSMMSDKAIILGVDRTFNLSKCFVTITTFKCNSVWRRNTGGFPIFMGPVFLHWDGLTKTYDIFFSHLRSLFVQGNSDLHNLQTVFFGSDEEAALTKSLRKFFPASQHLLCSRHLQQNVNKFLQDKVGLDQKSRLAVCQKIFGLNGLLQCDDSVTFDTRMQLFLDHLASLNNNSVIQYMTKRVLPIIKQQSCTTNMLSLDSIWTNNNCESMNKVLKLACDWKEQKLPMLVTVLNNVVNFQYAELRRALYGIGSFVLVPQLRTKEFSVIEWTSLTVNEKNKLFEKLLHFSANKINSVVSSDGTLQFCQNVTNSGKKPNQRKRTVAEKSRTFKRHIFK